jgi:SDR family mycofactocin-dependent oxidoreductase
MALLDGKVAFVTGASRAQGRAHAITMARNGADVIICDIGENVGEIPYDLGTAEELEETARLVEKEGRRVVSGLADVRSQQQLDDVVGHGIAQLGKVDILIANAGVHHITPIHEVTESEWAAVLDTNLGGVWRSVKAVLPNMIERGSGALVLISSCSALESGAGFSHYVASKYGVIGLSNSVAIEVAPHGVRCNAILPGFVKSGMTTTQAQLDKYAGHPGGTMSDLEHAGYSFHPMAGFSYLDPQRIADAALWLVSPGSEAVTGTAIPVDAGHVLVSGTVVRQYREA